MDKKREKKLIIIIIIIISPLSILSEDECADLECLECLFIKPAKQL